MKNRHSLFIFLLTSLASPLWAQTTPLTLPEAQQQAIQQNRRLKIARYKVDEADAKIGDARSKLYPYVLANGLYAYNGITRDLTLPRGSIGVLPGTTPIPLPQKDLTLFEARHNLFLGNVMAIQPISQIGKIKEGIKVARTDAALARTQVGQAERAIRQGVEKLFIGLLIAQKGQQQIQATIELTQSKLYDIESALLAGKTDAVNKVGLQADLANQQQQLLQTRNQIEDYTADLNELLGQPAETPLTVSGVDEAPMELSPLATYLETAKTSSPDQLEADQTLQKADLGVHAARKDYLPNLNAAGGYVFQNVFSDVPQNNYFLGLQLSYRILDFGQRKSTVNQRLAQQKQAEENQQYVREHLSVEVRKAYRKALQAQSLIPIAAQAAQYRRDELKLKSDRLVAGLALKREVLETQAALGKAEVDLYSAQLAYRLAVSDLERLSGK
ncbi:TolC family protein [Dyadobacter flavalbus]|uniref:TolC family protein n=1 Tax=Dyadobacter flavalbus TaxID=2579942 RepID=A0A5M8QV58_9BACT|nr:TolC family protein [Dyadobacter flavalbus]KAA6438022.1 TolC family protein [Dyadobacter flavalbus]